MLLIIQSCKKSNNTSVNNINYSVFFEKSNNKSIYFENIKYVNLATINEHPFARIDKLVIQDSLLFFSDIRGAKKIFCYDFNGKFKGVFGDIGKGKGEYIKLTDFDINSKGNLVIYCSPLKKLIEYDIEGNLISENKITFNARGIKCLPNNRILFALTNSSKMQNSMYAIYNIDNQLEKTFQPYHKKDKSDRVRYPYFSETNEGVLSYIPTRDMFFQFDKTGSIIDTIHFNFGNYSSPESFLFSAFDKAGDFNKGKSFAYINRTPSIINNNYIGELKLDNKALAGLNTEKYIYIADRTTKKVYLTSVSEENFSLTGVFPYLTTYNDSILISLLDIGNYGLLKHKEEIPLSVKNHIMNNGFTLTLKSKLCIEK